MAGERAAESRVLTILTKETEMPKMKTKSGAKKRFSLTASGRIKTGQAGKRQEVNEPLNAHPFTDTVAVIDAEPVMIG